MVMLDKGRVLKIGERREFERLRDAEPKNLTASDQRLMNQFLNGFATGPLTDAEGLSEFEKLIITG